MLSRIQVFLSEGNFFLEIATFLHLSKFEIVVVRDFGALVNTFFVMTSTPQPRTTLLKSQTWYIAWLLQTIKQTAFGLPVLRCRYKPCGVSRRTNVDKKTTRTTLTSCTRARTECTCIHSWAKIPKRVAALGLYCVLRASLLGTPIGALGQSRKLARSLKIAQAQTKNNGLDSKKDTRESMHESNSSLHA